MYDMYPRSWAEGRPGLDGAGTDRDGTDPDSTGPDSTDEARPTPRRRPRRAHAVAPRVQLSQA